MSRITDQAVIEVLNDPYFDHHTAMHLCREGLLPNPKDKCICCDEMKLVGKPGSGTEFLNMHHEMILVFKFLLNTKGVSYQPNETWDPESAERLPREILSLFQETDSSYVDDVFKGVKGRIAKANSRSKENDIDMLGRFIESPDNDVPGAGFHDTLHDYLGSMEGGFARGAEMNKLRNSMYNDYFWTLHYWIDAQYMRIADKTGKVLRSEPLDPKSTDCLTAKNHHHDKHKSHAAHG